MDQKYRGDTKIARPNEKNQIYLLKWRDRLQSIQTLEIYTNFKREKLNR